MGVVDNHDLPCCFTGGIAEKILKISNPIDSNYSSYRAFDYDVRMGFPMYSTANRAGFLWIRVRVGAVQHTGKLERSLFFPYALHSREYVCMGGASFSCAALEQA